MVIFNNDDKYNDYDDTIDTNHNNHSNYDYDINIE